MRKVLTLVLVVIMLTVCAFAEHDTADDIAITFRDFEWYTPYAVVDPIMIAAMGEDSDLIVCSANCNIDTIKYIVSNSTYSDDYAKDAGVKMKYYGVDVAGYTADAVLYYIYTTTPEGTICREEEQSMLCLGMYVFNEMADPDETYADLCMKLQTLYGTGDEFNGNGFRTIMWTDASGNQACIYYNVDNGVIRIAYSPSDLPTRLWAYNLLHEYESLLNENQLREENSGNTSGL